MPDETCGKTSAGYCLQLFQIIDKPSACASHSVSRANDDRKAHFVSDFFGFFHAKGQLAFRHIDAEAVHSFFECATVLTPLDGIDLNADYFDAIFFEHACIGKLGGKIKSALASEVWQ